MGGSVFSGFGTNPENERLMKTEFGNGSMTTATKGAGEKFLSPSGE